MRLAVMLAVALGLSAPAFADTAKTTTKPIISTQGGAALGTLSATPAIVGAVILTVAVAVAAENSSSGTD